MARNRSCVTHPPFHPPPWLPASMPGLGRGCNPLNSLYSTGLKRARQGSMHKWSATAQCASRQHALAWHRCRRLLPATHARVHAAGDRFAADLVAHHFCTWCERLSAPGTHAWALGGRPHAVLPAQYHMPSQLRPAPGAQGATVFTHESLLLPHDWYYGRPSLNCLCYQRTATRAVQETAGGAAGRRQGEARCAVAEGTWAIEHEYA